MDRRRVVEVGGVRTFLRRLGVGGDSGAGAARADEATERDVEMMRLALEEAQRAAEIGEIPVGAVVYETESGRVLARAHNLRERDADPTGHAELIAIREAARAAGDWRLNHCTLVVTLEPCVMCAGLIVNARVGRLVYGADDPKAGGVASLYRVCEDRRLNHRVAPIGGVMAEACGEILREFFRARRGRNRG